MVGDYFLLGDIDHDFLSLLKGCEFTSHGHCGVLVDNGHGTPVVDNDQTVELYCKMAVSQAR